MSHTAFAVDALSSQQKRDAAIQLSKAFETRNPRSLSVVNLGKYIEHDLRFESGVPALKQRLSRAPSGLTINTVHALVDGDFVVLRSEYRTPQQKQVVFDIFRFENGRIVEHWDNVEDESDAPNVSGRKSISRKS
jgi:predicted SnoaL-like aldol condensation-catalyzing enzyme